MPLLADCHHFAHALGWTLPAQNGGMHVPNPSVYLIPILNYPVAQWAVNALGYLALVFFTGRVLIQLVESKRKGESVSPPTFWRLSLAGGVLMVIYAFSVSDPVTLLQQLLMICFYLRNLYLIGKREKGRHFKKRRAKIIAAVLVFSTSVLYLGAQFAGLEAAANVANPDFFTVPVLQWKVGAAPVLIWGYVASGIFMSRFAVQWAISERRRKSVMPASFWILAIVGSGMLLIYYIVRSQTPPLLGHVLTIPTYLYNLYLIRRTTARRTRDAGAAASAESA